MTVVLAVIIPTENFQIECSRVWLTFSTSCCLREWKKEMQTPSLRKLGSLKKPETMNHKTGGMTAKGTGDYAGVLEELRGDFSVGLHGSQNQQSLFL